MLMFKIYSLLHTNASRSEKHPLPNQANLWNKKDSIETLNIEESKRHKGYVI
jgi:hypothetical protein